MDKIFISYAHDDLMRVALLRDFLVAIGHEVWMDEYDLPAGSNLNIELAQAIEKSDYFIACLSKNSVDHRGYVQKELKLGLDECYKVPEGKIFIIPVRFEECEVPYSLKKYSWLDIYKPDAKIKLLKSFKSSSDISIDEIHFKINKKGLFSLKHNEGRVAFRNGDYLNAEKLAREAYEEIPNPHSKLNEMVASYYSKKIIKRELDKWVYKLKLEGSGHGKSVLEKGF